MAFETIKHLKGGPKKRPTEVRVSAPRNGQRQASIHISFSGALLAELGWEKSDRVGIAVGTGNDHGWLRCQEDDLNGLSLVKFGNNAQMLTIRAARLYEGAPHRSELVEHRIEDDAVYIRLPAWAVPAAAQAA